MAKRDPVVECIAFAVWLDGWQDGLRLNFDQAKVLKRDEVRFTYQTADRIKRALAAAGHLKEPKRHAPK